MPVVDPFSVFPDPLRASTEHPTVLYERLPDCFALRGRVPDTMRSAVVFELEGGEISVCRGEVQQSDARVASDAISAVYTRGPAGPMAVPTGRVLVRFEEHVRASSRQDALEAVGYRIVETLPYARHAVWVESVDGCVSTSLQGIAGLEELPNVVNVEPQLLSERVHR